MLSEPVTPRTAGIVCGVVLVLCGLIYGPSWLPPPQLKPDEQVFKTVDALFTALTTKDAQRLEACATRLQTYRAEGQLPERPGRVLDDVITQARSGQWDPAARDLYAFIEGQRGE